MQSVHQVICWSFEAPGFGLVLLVSVPRCDPFLSRPSDCQRQPSDFARTCASRLDESDSCLPGSAIGWKIASPRMGGGRRIHRSDAKQNKNQSVLREMKKESESEIDKRSKQNSPTLFIGLKARLCRQRRAGRKGAAAQCRKVGP